VNKLIDAQDTICQAKDLAQAIFMMGESLADPSGNALTRVAFMLEEMLQKATDLIQSHRDEIAPAVTP
jgi:hypothetical protein